MESLSIDFIVNDYAFVNEVFWNIVQLAHNWLVNVDAAQTGSISGKVILIAKADCLVDFDSYFLTHILDQSSAFGIVFFLFAFGLSYLQGIFLVVFIKAYNFGIAIFFLYKHNGAWTERILEAALCWSDICFD